MSILPSSYGIPRRLLSNLLTRALSTDSIRVVVDPHAEEIQRVASFVKRFKRIAASSGLVIYNRKGYMETLTWLGITPRQAREIVLGLDTSNYHRNVSHSPNEHGEEICEFGAEVEGQEVYIKLIIDNTRQKAVCISFHVPKWPLSRPGGGEER